MAAYNFKKRFADKIESGDKNQAVRRIGKRHHAKPGGDVQMYTGMRTKSCKKIRDPDPTCLSVDPIAIFVGEEEINFIKIGKDVAISGDVLDQFAVADGFDDAADFHKFWLEFHGLGLFQGLLIKWTPPEESI